MSTQAIVDMAVRRAAEILARSIHLSGDGRTAITLQVKADGQKYEVTARRL